MANKTDKPQKGTREYWENKMRGGRYSLMLVLIFTVVNVAFLLLDFNSYFLFSASLPYYLTAFGKGIDNAFTNGSWDVTGTYTLTALGISVVILGIFLLCWLLSKKRYGWLVAALVLFLLDTLFLAGFTWLLLYINAYYPAALLGMLSRQGHTFSLTAAPAWLWGGLAIALLLVVKGAATIGRSTNRKE